MKRPLLLPLAPLFGAAVTARNFAYDSGWRKPMRLRWPVISVGSLSAGGAGKTPLVISLGQLLRAEGMEVDVLSRGYGRDGKATERVAPDGPADRFGDEPLLIARSAGVPVFVGTSRYAAGLLAEKSLVRPGVHLLDDGFQHRQLRRDVDIVLASRHDLDDSLLPAGNLREAASALERATILVVRFEERSLIEGLRARRLQQPVWLVNRKFEVPAGGMRSLAFCGIARPHDFFSQLTAHADFTGSKVVASRGFPDHHRYTSAEMEQLAALATATHADGYLTTEKDAVKLDDSLRAILERVAPLRIVRLLVVLEEEHAAILDLLARLEQ